MINTANNIKFSIIVPVYNTEDYVVKCIESIRNQSYSCFEVIIINDGSTDSTKKLLDEYIKKTNDRRFYLFHNHNCGVSISRNLGLRNATGEYVCFVDADDFLDTNFLSNYNDVINNQKIDIIYAGFRVYPSLKECPPYFETKDEVLNGIQLLNMFPEVNKKDAIPFSWRYCFRRQFLLENNLIFPSNIRFGEDTIYNIRALALAKSIKSINKISYNYRTDNVKKIGFKENLLLDLESNFKARYSISIDVLTTGKKYYDLDLAYKFLFHWLPVVIDNFKLKVGLTLANVKRMCQMHMFVDSATILIKNNVAQDKTQKLYLYMLAKRNFIFMYFIWKYFDINRFIP